MGTWKFCSSLPPLSSLSHCKPPVYYQIIKKTNKTLVIYHLFQCERLAGGVTKILEASEELEELNAKLAIQKTAVAEKTAACEQLLSEIKEGKQSVYSSVNNHIPLQMWGLVSNWSACDRIYFYRYRVARFLECQ